MLKSKRKLIITLSIVGVIVLLIILSSALFSLRTVSVDYLTLNSDVSYSVLKTYDKDEIVKVGQFAYNKNILFIKYDGAKDRIEKAFPFAKVVGFTRHFPSSVVVSLAEREAVAKIYRTDGKWVVIDDELKVLIVSSTLDSYYSSLPTLDSSLVAVNSAKEGYFLSGLNLAKVLHNIKRGVTNTGVNLNMRNITSINISNNAVINDYEITMELNDGCVVVIQGLNNLAEKSLGAFTTYKDVRSNLVGNPENPEWQYVQINEVTITIEADYNSSNKKTIIEHS